jgi:hypothetical protein
MGAPRLLGLLADGPPAPHRASRSNLCTRRATRIHAAYPRTVVTIITADTGRSSSKRYLSSKSLIELWRRHEQP